MRDGEENWLEAGTWHVIWDDRKREEFRSPVPLAEGTSKEVKMKDWAWIMFLGDKKLDGGNHYDPKTSSLDKI